MKSVHGYISTTTHANIINVTSMNLGLKNIKIETLSTKEESY